MDTTGYKNPLSGSSSRSVDVSLLSETEQIAIIERYNKASLAYQMFNMRNTPANPQERFRMDLERKRIVDEFNAASEPYRALVEQGISPKGGVQEAANRSVKHVHEWYEQPDDDGPPVIGLVVIALVAGLAGALLGAAGVSLWVY